MKLHKSNATNVLRTVFQQRQTGVRPAHCAVEVEHPTRAVSPAHHARLVNTSMPLKIVWHVLLGTFLKIQTVQIVPNAELVRRVNLVQKEPVRVCDVTPEHFNPNPACV